jgi:hypothetical protein
LVILTCFETVDANGRLWVNLENLEDLAIRFGKTGDLDDSKIGWSKIITTSRSITHLVTK